MGDWADREMEQEMQHTARAHGVGLDDDDDGQVGYWRAQREDRQDERRAQLNKAKCAMAETTAQVAALGLQLVRKSEYHYHVLRGREVVAQWWPSSGKTMDGRARGQMCRKALVAWLRDSNPQNRRPR
jgi:hypothetical protein